MKLGQGDAERDMRAKLVMLEQGHAEERVPGGDILGEPVRVTVEAVETIPQNAVEAVEVDDVGKLRLLSHHHPDLDPLQAAPIAMLGGLDQGDSRGRLEDRPVSLAI